VPLSMTLSRTGALVETSSIEQPLTKAQLSKAVVRRRCWYNYQQ